MDRLWQDVLRDFISTRSRAFGLRFGPAIRAFHAVQTIQALPPNNTGRPLALISKATPPELPHYVETTRSAAQGRDAHREWTHVGKS